MIIMGMKKSSVLGLMAFAMAISATEEGIPITKQGDLEPSEPKPPKKRKPKKPFKEQDGVVKLISEYKSIQEGTSKKGSMKQARTISKINNWIDKGYLIEEDIS